MQVSLSSELAVCADDEAAGDTELLRERACRRQRRPGPEPARADGITELPLELSRERLRGTPVELDQQLGRTNAPVQLVQRIGTKLDLNNDHCTSYRGRRGD